MDTDVTEQGHISSEFLCEYIQTFLSDYDNNVSTSGKANLLYDYSNNTLQTNSSLNYYYNGTDYHESSSKGFEVAGVKVLEDVKFYLNGFVNPALCVCGLVGNVLNILVLTRRRIKVAMDCSMERAAHLCLIALAISDMLYCLSVLPGAFVSRGQVVYKDWFWMLVRVSIHPLQNLFTNTSTWLTLIMAVGRYAAICRPLHARYLVEVRTTKASVALVFILWTLLALPMFWTYKTVKIICQPDDQSYYLLDRGYFVEHKMFKQVYTYLWAIVGCFIPILVLIYCNVHLIKALRESLRMRKLYRVHSRSVSPSAHITPTLVAIVCMFLILVSPAEILNFYYYAVHKEAVEAFSVGIVVCNVLQTLNFSMNFLLYCLVNTKFRETVVEVMHCMCFRKPKTFRATFRRKENSSSSNNNTMSSKSFIIITAD